MKRLYAAVRAAAILGLISLVSCGSSMQNAAIHPAPEAPAPVQQYQARESVAMKAVPSEKGMAKGEVQYRFAESSGTAPQMVFNTEEYERVHENAFLETLKNPLSTFSIDVDTASYSNVRRFLQSNTLPYADAVRTEELINYFKYDYPSPKGDDPIAFTTELADCPWNEKSKLLLIGLQAKKIDIGKLPSSNLVFLIDVSGSMDMPEKLPLVVSSLKMLVNELRPQDHISIVVYAGSAGLVLPSTPGSEKRKIISVLDQLQAGGTTAGGEGIALAYKIAKESFIAKGNNRVILATDGDFNVGVSSTSELERLIEEKRKEGIFLTVLGYGMGNYKDNRITKLADKGNGNAAYIDNLLEAKKVLVTQMGGTLFTIAKDVKVQIEFNPTKVSSYRLIGYEKRVMRAEEFNDDTKDAGEMGSGHTVTVLYEIVPAGATSDSGHDLKYQKTTVTDGARNSNELATVKFRYKNPSEDKSVLLTHTIADKSVRLKNASGNLRLAAAVAEWAMILRDSEFKGKASFSDVLGLARDAKGQDPEGYRAEFIKLVELSELLKETSN